MAAENIDETQLIEHLKNASRIVRQWPEWKRGILASSTQTTTTPRPVVQPEGQTEVEQGSRAEE